MHNLVLITFIAVYCSISYLIYCSISAYNTQNVIDKCRRSKSVALTFDDGPNWDTKNILTILERNNIKATFFVLGKNILGNEEHVKQAFENGHVIAAHTFKHYDLRDLSDNDIRHEMISASELIQKVTGKWPKYYRPPYGYYNSNVIHIGQELGQQAICWNIDTEDWKDLENAPLIVNKLLGNEDTAIILMHEKSGISKHLQYTIDLAREREFEFVTMDECFNY